jgi:hypothetical protein
MADLKFDIGALTLEEVTAEYDRTLDQLERLSALRSAMVDQDHRRIQKLIVDYRDREKGKLEV